MSSMPSKKFKDLVHYIIEKCPDPTQLGSIRLNKTLWFVDVLSYQRSGSSITGDDVYIKRQHGPVPKKILNALRQLEKEGRIKIQQPEFEFDTTKYVSLVSTDESALADDEKLLTDNVLAAMLGHSASAISEETHDLVWRAVKVGDEIPLFATLVSVSGRITEEVSGWADRIISNANSEVGT